MNTTTNPSSGTEPASDGSDDEAAEVAARLEAAAAAMAAGPSSTDISELPQAGGDREGEDPADASGKPAGRFEAQQNAERAARETPQAEDTDGTGRMGRMMKKTDPLSVRWLAGALLVAPLTLGGCRDPTRFKQERYECGYNPQGLVEPDFRDIETGSDAKVTFKDETLSMPIIESSDDAFTLAQEGLIIRIDRNSAIVRVTRGSRYRNVKCEKSEFRM